MTHTVHKKDLALVATCPRCYLSLYSSLCHKSCVLPGKSAAVSIKVSGFSINVKAGKVESVNGIGYSIKKRRALSD